MAPSRRSFLKTGSAAMLGLSVQGSASRLFAAGPPRIGIVGGGLSGVASAWLLDGVAEAVVFEARPELGGHAQTIPLVADGQLVEVDVGAQFFGPGTHPTYEKLLELIGLLNPERPGLDATIDVDMTITITETAAPRPRFVSPSADRAWPLFAPWNRDALEAFLVFALHAKPFAEDGDWLITLGDWLAGLPVPPEQRDGLLLPLLAALTGCSLEQAPALSARSAIFFIGAALPSLRYRNSLLGLGGNVEHLARQSHNLTTHLAQPVTAVHPRLEGGYEVRSAAGVSEVVDAVIFASPPYLVSPLLAEIPALAEAAALLAQFEFFTAEIALHRDAAYMPSKPAWWSAYNANIEGGRCEGSIWYGALRPVVPGHGPVSAFKSWATARSQPPQHELYRRAFRHPFITPAFIETQRSLAEHQGTAGVWFAGSYNKEVDSQETALTSAMDVVRDIAPNAPNLIALGG